MFDGNVTSPAAIEWNQVMTFQSLVNRCPEEFKQKNQWYEYALHFYGDANREEIEKWEWDINPEDRKRVLKLLRENTWDTAYRLLEEKIPVLCWIFASVLRRVPAAEHSWSL